MIEKEMYFYHYVGDFFLKIESNRGEEFNSIIIDKLKKMACIKQIEKNQTRNLCIKFYKKCTYLIVDKKTYKLNKATEKSDLYIILNALIYKYLLKKNIYSIHSSLVSNNYKNLLIIGGFSMGKTTLGLCFEKNNYNIETSDQTFFVINNNKLEKISGSRYIKYKDNSYYIEDFLSDSVRNVSKVLFIKGLCDGGKSFIEEENNEHRIVFDLWKSMTWPFYSFIPSINSILPIEIDYEQISNFIFNILPLCDFYTLRGDPNDLARIISKND